jgi:hypothetical protein
MLYVRITSASLFLISILLLGFTLFGDRPIAHAAVSLLLWGSLGTFCLTEGFLIKSPERTKLNIYGARFFFVAACLVVAQIVFALLTGRVQ